MKMYELEVTSQSFAMECTFKVLVRKTMLNRIIPIFEDMEGVKVKYVRTV